jgi:CheY-like chemotaxis protein
MKKILVAEDDKYLRSAYLLKLGKVGFEVRAASDGEEALGILKEFTPDLILLDLVMPKKDGYATLADLQKNAEWKKIPVIITTNLGLQEEIDKAAKFGCQDYIVKSDMRIDDIVSKIKIKLGL